MKPGDIVRTNISEPWEFSLPTGETSFDVKIIKIGKKFVLASILSPFEWKNKNVKFIVGVCRYIGEQISNKTSLNIATLDCDIDSIQHLDLEAAWEKGQYSFIGSMTVERK